MKKHLNTAGIFILRCALGIMFFVLGLQHITQQPPVTFLTAKMTTWLGLSLSSVIYTEGILVLMIGILLMMGWLTRIVAIIGGILLFVIIAKGNLNQGVSYITEVAGAVVLAITGAREWSIDARLNGQVQSAQGKRGQKGLIWRGDDIILGEENHKF